MALSWNLSQVRSTVFDSDWKTNGSNRHAQELKLHESREVHQSPSMGVGDTLSLFWYEEYKRRLWANVFVFDG